MIRRFTNKAVSGLLLLAFTLVSTAMVAQNVVYSEDFSGGLTGWTSADASGGPAVWTWCDDPNDATGAGCVANWATYSDQHDMTYNSSTAANGFAVMDSDVLQALGTNHQATLTSDAIDFSAQSEVWLKFESLLGVFGNPTLGLVFLQVSNDGTNFTNFDIVDIAAGNTGNEPGISRWTVNPEFSVIDISAVAAGQSTVYIRFWWDGNWEYYWLLDDIEAFDADPSAMFFPANDVAVNTFFSIAPNAMTPAGQEMPISFLADVANPGINTAENVNLQVTINDGNTDVFNETLAYGQLLPDSTAENQPFATTYTPSGPAGTMYTGTYSITSDSTDEVADNDSRSFTFMISDSTFAKENGPTRGVAPAAANWDAGEELSWGFGNYFFTPNGAGKFARHITFGINNAAEITGQIVFLKLYEWNDADGNNFAEATERLELANTLYVIAGDEPVNELMTIKLTGTDGLPADIPLKDNGRYIVAMEFVAPNDQVTITMPASEEFNYAAQVFQQTDVNMEETPYLCTMIIVNNPINSEAYDPGGFGNDVVPVIRLSIGDESLVAARELLDELEVSLTPNPATSFVQLSVNLDEVAKDMTAIIVNADGKVMKRIAYGNIQDLNETIDVADLAAGNYWLHLGNNESSATRQFVVVK